jgi:hypothetical protein
VMTKSASIANPEKNLASNYPTFRFRWDQQKYVLIVETLRKKKNALVAVSVFARFNAMVLCSNYGQNNFVKEVARNINARPMSESSVMEISSCKKATLRLPASMPRSSYQSIPRQQPAYFFLGEYAAGCSFCLKAANPSKIWHSQVSNPFEKLWNRKPLKISMLKIINHQMLS